MKSKVGPGSTAPSASFEVGSTSEPIAQPDQDIRPGFNASAPLLELRPRPDANRPRSLKGRIASKLSERQRVFNFGIPGTGRTINRPLRSGVPVNDQPSADTHSADLDPLALEARQLKKLAKSTLASLKAAPIAVWDRPASPAKRSVGSQLRSWLRPASLRTIVGKKPAKPDAASQQHNPASVVAMAAALIERLDHERQGLDAALTALAQVRAECETIRHALRPTSLATALANPAQLRNNHQRLEQAQVRLQSAETHARLSLQRLRDSVHDKEVMRVCALSEQQDQTRQQAEISRQLLSDLQAGLCSVDARIMDRQAATTQNLEAKVAQTRALMSQERDRSIAERAVVQTETRLHSLRNQLQASNDPAQIAVLEAAIAQTQDMLAGTLQTHMQLEQLLAHVEAECAGLNDEIGTLHRQRAADAGERVGINAAERELHRTRQQLIAEQSTAEELCDQVAVKQVREHHLTNQIAATQDIALRDAAEMHAPLQRIATGLSGPDTPTPLPAFAVIEIVTSALTELIGNDAARAKNVLDAMYQHSAWHWPRIAENMSKSSRTRPTGSNNTHRDIVALCRKLAKIPRGVEIMQLLSNQGGMPAPADNAQALRVFWNADDAQLSESDLNVKAWLQTAKQVALATVAGRQQTFDDVHHAAFNAVRNGYFSNAPGSPYDQHDRRLRKATNQWVMRAAASSASQDNAETAIKKAPLPRRIIPTLEKTPFGKSTLNRSYAVSESMGLHSPRLQVDQAIARRMRRLEDTLQACQAVPEMQYQIMAVQAMLKHLRSMEEKGAHLSQVIVCKRDSRAIRRLLKSTVQQRQMEQKWDKPIDASGRREFNILQHSQSTELLPLHAQVASGKLSVYELIELAQQHVHDIAPTTLALPLPTDDLLADDLSAAAKLLKHQHMRSREDIVAFFKPLILNSQLRDRLRLGAGGTLGMGLPTLPYGPLSLVASPILFLEKSHGSEAFAQISMPILGMEMSFGSARTNAGEVGIGARIGAQVAPGIGFNAAVTGRAIAEGTTTSSTTMRFFRVRNKDDEMRSNMLNALDSMVRWDVLEPKRGRQYAGPLECIFARNPDVSISQGDNRTCTRTLTAGLEVNAPMLRFKDGSDGPSQMLGLGPSAYVEVGRIREGRTETGGVISIVGNRSDAGKQNAGLTANLNPIPVSYIPPQSQDSRYGVQSESLGLQLRMSRDLAWALEKNEISPFLIGDRQDADLDRHYSSSTDMLAEIAGNRAAWLLRCIETLEPDATGRRNTTDNRLRAAKLLDAFEARVASLEKESHYCQYNVNYSMRRRAGAEIDGYRGIKALALQRGDKKSAEDAQHAIDEILLMPETWRPLMLIVRERGRDSTTKGWRGLLRLQRFSNVDSQRTVVQFPPV
ncbi:type III effector [Xanthomonas hortorum pv. vitians]|uniref:type III effector n=1 Tax=Xanthomonas hortorum TaxID=56454 RepID=UPI001F3D6EC7|nr:type III effector [Xanthomonas hortorum]MCE4285455.1 type III effector [Xanthomonas hortorum pv. vitians]